MTDAELAILSIIAEGPIHGYDVQTVIAERGIRAWAQIGVSSIYYVLEKLERQGLVESTVTQGADDTARRQYRITTAGIGVLQTAIADLIGTPREHADEFELGLANLPTLRPDQVRTALTAYRQELASRLAHARERSAALQAAQAPFTSRLCSATVLPCSKRSWPGSRVSSLPGKRRLRRTNRPPSRQKPAKYRA